MKRSNNLSILGTGLCCFIVGFDFSIVSTSLSHIQENLYASMSSIQWVMNIFALFMATFLLTMGRISDNIGKKNLLTLGLILFIIGTLIAGFAETSYMLIAARALQGFAAAMLMPGSQALMADLFPQKQKAMGYWAGIMGTGVSLGPPVGCIISAYASWRWIFFINTIIAFAALVILFTRVQESKKQVHHQPLDLLGLLSLTTSLSAFVFGLIQGPNWGYSSPYTLLCFGISFAFFLIFILAEKIEENPLIDLRFFENRVFTICAFPAFILIFFVWTIFFLSPLYLHKIIQLKPNTTAIILLLICIPSSILNLKAGTLATKVSEKGLMLAGLLLISLSLLMQTYFGMKTSVLFISISFLFFGAGWGILQPPTFALSLMSFPPKYTGTASGMLATITEIGGCIGLAISGSLFQFIDNGSVAKSLLANNISISNTNLTLIKSQMNSPDSLSTLMNQLSLSDQKIPSILHNSFVLAYDTTMWLCFGLSVAVFLIVFFALREQ